MARTWAELTQAELAQRVGVRAETVSSWEKGRTRAGGQGYRMAVKVAEACGVPFATFHRWAGGEP